MAHHGSQKIPKQNKKLAEFCGRFVTQHRVSFIASQSLKFSTVFNSTRPRLT